MRALPLAALALALASATLHARPARFAPLPENVPAELAGSDGEVVIRTCSGCHSLEYIATQPRGKGAQFWKDAVAKMVTVYKAPIDPADAEAVATALAAKYG